MTSQERDELRLLCEAATPGEWLAEPHIAWVSAGRPGERLNTTVVVQLPPLNPDVMLRTSRAYADLNLIAAAHNALPALLTDSEELAALRERLSWLVKEWDDAGDFSIAFSERLSSILKEPA